MTSPFFWPGLRRCALTMALGALSPWSAAAPGAHGPNGEHLDAPASNAQPATAQPRFEAQTELFELVGTLAGGELSLLIDRFETNEPVLKAQVEVESGGLKAQARFHADHGDYVVDDAAMLKALAQAGTHPLVITVLAGAESDLMDAGLVVGADAADHGHEHGDGHAHGYPKGHPYGGSPGLANRTHDMSPRAMWLAGLALLALTVMAVVMLRRRGRAWGADQEGQA
jgi:hypothetical protein